LIDGLSGNGKYPVFAKVVESPRYSAVALLIRTESRADQEKPPSWTKAIVPRMTRIVMTTINSTRVNPRVFILSQCIKWGVVRYQNWRILFYSK
jgi:hypothetical protein